VREEQESNDAGKGGRKRGDDDEGIKPRLKVHDDQEVDENDGKDESTSKPSKSCASFASWPRTVMKLPRGKDLRLASACA